MRRIVLGATVFVLLFGSLTFVLAWRKVLMPAAEERPAPAAKDSRCEDECTFGARWEDVSLWPAEGAPSLDTYPELRNAEYASTFSLSASRYAPLMHGVGRIQFRLKGRERPVVTSCTAFLVSPMTVVTAGHCILIDKEAAELEKASIRFGFWGDGNDGTLYDLNVKSREPDPTDRALDYLLLDFESEATAARVNAAGYKPLRLTTVLPAASKEAGNEDLFLIAHPLALAQVIIRAHCRAVGIWKSGATPAVLHSCGTAPGVSGAPVFRDKCGTVAGMHAQARDATARPMGYAIPLLEIAKRSSKFAAIVAASTSEDPACR